MNTGARPGQGRLRLRQLARGLVHGRRPENIGQEGIGKPPAEARHPVAAGRAVVPIGERVRQVTTPELSGQLPADDHLHTRGRRPSGRLLDRERAAGLPHA